MNKQILITVGLCTGLLLLAACAPAATQQASGSDLTGQVWALSLLLDKGLVPDSGISI